MDADHVAGLESGTLRGAVLALRPSMRGRKSRSDRRSKSPRRKARWRGGSWRWGRQPRSPPAYGRRLRGKARSHAPAGVIRARAAAIGHAGAIGVAMELDVAAERDRRHLPACAVTVVEAEELGTEADGEGVNADAAPATDEEMAHLVDEDHDAEHDDEGDHRRRRSRRRFPPSKRSESPFVDPQGLARGQRSRLIADRIADGRERKPESGSPASQIVAMRLGPVPAFLGQEG